MTHILKRLETVKLDNLSKDEINIINKSINLSDSISNPNPSHNNMLYLSLYIPVVGVFHIFLNNQRKIKSCCEYFVYHHHYLVVIHIIIWYTNILIIKNTFIVIL